MISSIYQMKDLRYREVDKVTELGYCRARTVAQTTPLSLLRGPIVHIHPLRRSNLAQFACSPAPVRASVCTA